LYNLPTPVVPGISTIHHGHPGLSIPAVGHWRKRGQSALSDGAKSLLSTGDALVLARMVTVPGEYRWSSFAQQPKRNTDAAQAPQESAGHERQTSLGVHSEPVFQNVAMFNKFRNWRVRRVVARHPIAKNPWQDALKRCSPARRLGASDQATLRVLATLFPTRREGHRRHRNSVTTLMRDCLQTGSTAWLAAPAATSPRPLQSENCPDTFFGCAYPCADRQLPQRQGRCTSLVAQAPVSARPSAPR
jgi:hypothetical protein